MKTADIIVLLLLGMLNWWIIVSCYFVVLELCSQMYNQHILEDGGSNIVPDSLKVGTTFPLLFQTICTFQQLYFQYPLVGWMWKFETLLLYFVVNRRGVSGTPPYRYRSNFPTKWVQTVSELKQNVGSLIQDISNNYLSDEGSI